MSDLYNLKPVPVTAKRLVPAGIQEARAILEWCGGRGFAPDFGPPGSWTITVGYGGTAIWGNWIVQSEDGFVVMSDEAFADKYDAVEDQSV